MVMKGRWYYPVYQLSAHRENMSEFAVNGRTLYAADDQKSKTVSAILSWAADGKLFPPSLIIHAAPVTERARCGEPHNEMVMYTHSIVDAEVNFGAPGCRPRMVLVTFYHYEYLDGRGEVPHSRRADVTQMDWADDPPVVYGDPKLTPFDPATATEDGM